MARNKSGGFNKVLEFIGLVDDEDPRDTYEDEYQSGDYGRQQPYTPQRRDRSPKRPQQQQQITRRPAQPRSYEPTRAPRMDRNAPSSSRFDQPAPRRSGQAQPTRRPNPFVEHVDDRAGRYDYSPRTPSRFGSLNSDTSTRYADEAPVQRAPRAAARQRTEMFTLHTLEDCCDVIDSLLQGNTVVLTMDDLDTRLMQRAVDTLSGAVFALHASIRKASERTYLIAPEGVMVNENYDMDRRF